MLQGDRETSLVSGGVQAPPDSLRTRQPDQPQEAKRIADYL